jgi:small-conductance mechanosensitive channel
MKFDFRLAAARAHERALEAVGRAVRMVEGVLDEPAPEVAIVDFGETGVGLQARYWTSSAGATVNRASTEARLHIKQALDEAGVEFALLGRERPAREPDLAPAGSATAARA